ncbi:hypothetical protein FS749_009599 [Ceratobasidium sp. UAMH 11750]|nr:hypothetical protein FS749_009599 [Ceratobasidium sp. UAMH 11750]
MDPDRPSKRTRLEPRLNPPSHATGANPPPQRSSSATGVIPPNAQTAIPTPAIVATSSSTSRYIPVFRPKNPFRALGKVAAVIPPLQPVVDLLAECMDGLSISSENRKDYETFSTNITMTMETLKGHLDQPNSAILTDSVSGTIGELRKQADYISKKQERSKRKRLMDAERDEADLLRCYRNVDSLLQQLSIDMSLTISRVGHETLEAVNRGLDVTKETRDLMERHLSHTQIDRMDPVKEARYNSGAKEVRRTGCTPNTRTSVMEQMMDWANDTDGAKIYWMSGMAGTGKTTIAWSLCKKLEDENRLGASFFCSRLVPGCRDIARIVPTLSHQLACVSTPFRDELCRVLENDRYICSADISSQFEKMINQPLQKVDQTIRGIRLVVVIDALDECSDRGGVQFILDVLFQFAARLPIKFFVTCRPEPSLFDKVLSAGEATRSIFHLHDIEESQVQADIETYLSTELASIPVSPDQIKLLTERSGKLFIYAATVVQYLRPSTTRVSPERRLPIVLGTASNLSSKFYGPLDSLYTTILSAAVENTELEPWDVENIKLMLYTVLCAREPMTIGNLTHLLRLGSPYEARQAIEPLRPVLHVSNIGETVSTLHMSFPDYMRDRERSGRFWCDETTHHELIAERCFDIMRDLLRFNICGLESSFVLDKDVHNFSNRVEMAIPPHLSYACRYWCEHLVLSRNINVHAPRIEEFLSNLVLFWIEAMSLKRCIGLAVSILSELYGRIRVSVGYDSSLTFVDQL